MRALSHQSPTFQAPGSPPQRSRDRYGTCRLAGIVTVDLILRTTALRPSAQCRSAMCRFSSAAGAELFSIWRRFAKAPSLEPVGPIPNNPASRRRSAVSIARRLCRSSSLLALVCASRAGENFPTTENSGSNPAAATGFVQVVRLQ